MRLEHEQDDDAAGDDHERHNAVADRLHLVFVCADHAREKQHDRDLCDLRRLKRRKAETQPPARAAADHADVRDPDDGEQENTHAQQRERPAMRTLENKIIPTTPATAKPACRTK